MLDKIPRHREYTDMSCCRMSKRGLASLVGTIVACPLLVIVPTGEIGPVMATRTPTRAIAESDTPDAFGPGRVDTQLKCVISILVISLTSIV
ncbi:hypothetical protein AVEN_265902-1 [Araneus ventricosus]|uniref:Uncharacterized protein n=1 Tax=Araneus ventricosus TaxID=182803 RepID=A0A4Y2JE77_ARAVE|nr:hypothetical protein AVEN_265902-1 [Araneus ventricosus]